MAPRVGGITPFCGVPALQSPESFGSVCSEEQRGRLLCAMGDLCMNSQPLRDKTVLSLFPRLWRTVQERPIVLPSASPQNPLALACIRPPHSVFPSSSFCAVKLSIGF